ncbi:ComEC/Rec2 family competence protein [Occallatibacter riparius]|uniref:ComEC/Rec2 family competence protein n=1 Tax=Occallatibacter riparius TaxID=1002689 RepID=A0A9J7BYT1_9BACT|nr:ComEC/Rec2 family competence protein [Occallatibacter riparius]UWZ86733.1 ComEC/Rec2 family competence protein [Occallatibacter riparius]
MEQGSVRNGTFAEAAVGGVAGVPLFHAAWLFAAGIALTAAVWMQPGTLLISLILLTAACAAAALRAPRMTWIPMALLWVLLGAWCAEMEPHPAPAEPLHGLSDGLLRTVEGTVTSAGPVRGELEPDVNESGAELPSQRVDVRLASIEVVDDASDRLTTVNGTVRLTIRWAEGQTPFTIGCGERIRAAGRLLPPQRYRDPGAWDRAAYLLGQGVTSTATVKAERVERLGVAQRRTGLPFWPCLLSNAQHAAAARLLALPAAMRGWPGPLRISQEDAIMLAAMVTGDRTFLSHGLRVGFERTGSFHMLVVSGLHLAIVAGFIAWIARRLRIPRAPATLLTIAVSFGYALFTGFATPVQRSLWMVSLYLVGRLIYRERSPLNTIGFAVLCLLVASPRSLFEASFQMTLLAVVTIAGIAVPLLKNSVEPYKNATRDLRTVAMDVKLAPRVAEFRVTMRMIAARMRRATGSRWVGARALPWSVRFVLSCVEALVVTLVVELAMTLPMVVYFHRVTLFALPVNLFILPLLLVLMPAALVTLLVALISPAMAAVPGAVTAALLHIGVGLVRLFGSKAWGDLRMPAPVAVQVAGFCALLAMAILLARLQRRGLRRSAWAALIAAAVVAVAPRAIEHPRDALLVEAIDVGQGDSLLIVTPDGKTLLVDGGGFGGGPRMSAPEFDIGEEVVSPALWARGIRHLDAVALSHAHSDHMGGLPAVLRNFHPDELWVGNNPPVAPYEALVSEAAAQHTRVRSLREGDAMTLGAAQVRVMAPLPDYAPGKEPSNNDSLVLRVAYGASSVLLEGDAEAPVERGMLEEAGLESTLLKVGHHGSTSSSKPEFLGRVSPRWAVISCGLRNRYGHPRQEVLEELQAAHVRTAVTDVNGAACFSLDGKTDVRMSGCGR